MGIEDVAAELYGLAPEDFTAARNARVAEAKASGDRDLAAAVRSLRKPTADAWLLNQLVRQRRDEVDRVLELGARLRAAQGTLGAAELRALDGQRRQLTRAVAQRAVADARDAGRTVSAAVAASVEETLRSAMVDAQAGAALAAGLLTNTFSSTGLEPVDLSRVVAVAGPAVRSSGSGSRTTALTSLTAAETHERAVADARRAVEQAGGELAAARVGSEQARNRAVEARRRREDLQSELDAALRRLAEREEQLTAAAEADDTARRAQLGATRAERAALESADRAQRALDALLEDWM